MVNHTFKIGFIISVVCCFLYSCNLKHPKFDDLNIKEWNTDTSDYISDFCNLNFLPSKNYPEPSIHEFISYIDTTFINNRNVLKDLLINEQINFNTDELIELKEIYIRNREGKIDNPVYWIGDSLNTFRISFKNDEYHFESFSRNKKDFYLNSEKKCDQLITGAIDIGNMSMTILSNIKMNEKLDIETDKILIDYW